MMSQAYTLYSFCDALLWQTKQDPRSNMRNFCLVVPCYKTKFKSNHSELTSANGKYSLICTSSTEIRPSDVDMMIKKLNTFASNHHKLALKFELVHAYIWSVLKPSLAVVPTIQAKSQMYLLLITIKKKISVIL